LATTLCQPVSAQQPDPATKIRELVDQLRSRGGLSVPTSDPVGIQKQLVAYGEAAVPFLIEGLSHSAEDVRKYSARTLGSMGDVARPALPLLLARLNSETQFSQFDFVRAIRELLRPEDEQAIEPLLTLMKSDLNTRYTLNVRTVVEAFGILGPRAAAVVPDLIALFPTSDAVVGDETLARTLGLIGPPAERALPQLVLLLEDRLRGVDNTAAAAIVRIGWEKSGVPLDVLVDELLGGVTYGDAYEQEAAAVFTMLGARAENELVELARRTQDQRTLESVVNVLDDINAQSDRAVDVLIDGTRRTNGVSIRGRAALALGDIAGDPEVVQVLTRVAREKETPFVRILAQRSLNRIRGSTASMFEGIVTPASLAGVVSSLLSMLDSDDRKLSELAVQALIELGEPAVPQLIRAFNTPLPFSVLRPMNPVNPTTSRVHRILLEIGDRAAPYLIDPILESNDEKILEGAIGVLAELSFEPNTTREKIVYYFVKDAASASEVRSAGRPTFGRLREVGAEAKPFLLRIAQMTALTKSHKDALEALSEFGPLSRDLVPALARLHGIGVIDDYFYVMMVKIGGDEALDQYVAALRSASLAQIDTDFMVLSLIDMTDIRDQRLVDVFLELTRSDNRGTRIAAYAGLSTKRLFTVPGVDRMLLAGLDDRDDLVKYNIINYLGSKGRTASFALSKLREIAKRPGLPNDLIGIDGLDFRQTLQKAIGDIEGR
jgi:HEAT repeat protein